MRFIFSIISAIACALALCVILGTFFLIAQSRLQPRPVIEDAVAYPLPTATAKERPCSREVTYGPSSDSSFLTMRVDGDSDWMSIRFMDPGGEKVCTLAGVLQKLCLSGEASVNGVDEPLLWGQLATELFHGARDKGAGDPQKITGAFQDSMTGLFRQRGLGRVCGVHVSASPSDWPHSLL